MIWTQSLQCALLFLVLGNAILSNAQLTVFNAETGETFVLTEKRDNGDGTFVYSSNGTGDATVTEIVVTITPPPEDTVAKLRGFILSGNQDGLSQVLSNVGSGTNKEEISTGYRFEEGQEDLFLKTSDNRARDPDVVTIRSFAQSILYEGGNATELAEVWLGIVYQEGPGFVPDPAGTYMDMFNVLSNRTLLLDLLESEPEPVEVDSSGRRLFAAKAQSAKTSMCASCFKPDACKAQTPLC